jgi:hypothetical protein
MSSQPIRLLREPKRAASYSVRYLREHKFTRKFRAVAELSNSGQKRPSMAGRKDHYQREGFSFRVGPGGWSATRTVLRAASVRPSGASFGQSGQRGFQAGRFDRTRSPGRSSRPRRSGLHVAFGPRMIVKHHGRENLCVLHDTHRRGVRMGRHP